MHIKFEQWAQFFTLTSVHKISQIFILTKTDKTLYGFLLQNYLKSLIEKVKLFSNSLQSMGANCKENHGQWNNILWFLSKVLNLEQVP